MTFELPLFPLNTVLFPGMPLPLHIFEPRYRLLTRRCLEGGTFGVERAFGVTLLAEGEEGSDNTVPVDIGTTAQITQVSPLPDGRFNLQTTGRRRFHVLSRRMEDEYWVGFCRWLDDDPCAEDLHGQSTRVMGAVQDYLRAVAQGAGVSVPDFNQLGIPAAPYEFSMWVASLLPLNPVEKQPLLELTSTSARLDQEYSLLRRFEVIQRAYSRREASGTASTTNIDDYVSLN